MKSNTLKFLETALFASNITEKPNGKSLEYCKGYGEFKETSPKSIACVVSKLSEYINGVAYNGTSIVFTGHVPYEVIKLLIEDLKITEAYYRSTVDNILIIKKPDSLLYTTPLDGNLAYTLAKVHEDNFEGWTEDTFRRVFCKRVLKEVK